MKNKEIIKAWKDTEYRSNLGNGINKMPEHPAGWANLSDLQLGEVFGGLEENNLAVGTQYLGSLGCCTFGPKVCGFTVGVLTYGCCPDLN